MLRLYILHVVTPGQSIYSVSSWLKSIQFELNITRLCQFNIIITCALLSISVSMLHCVTNSKSHIESNMSPIGSWSLYKCHITWMLYRIISFLVHVHIGQIHWTLIRIHVSIWLLYANCLCYCKVVKFRKVNMFIYVLIFNKKNLTI